MTPRARGLLGAAVGALAVLAVLPQTRPGMRAAFLPRPPGGLGALLSPPFEKPKDLATGAAYLHRGAERLIGGPSLTSAERETLAKVAARCGEMERENAFWPLARAVFRGEDGVPNREDWLQASRRPTYDDYQSKAAAATFDRVSARVGDSQAWIYAALATRRSQAMALAIKRAAFRTLERAPARDHDELALETIHNGASLREGSRQYRIAAYGMAMIEAATYPSGAVIEGPGTVTDPGTRNIRRLVINQGKLTSRLSASGRRDEARFCAEQFRTNDSWSAFLGVQDTEGRFRALAIIAALVASLPGALMVASLAGALVWLFALRVAAVAHHHGRFRGPGLAACSLALLTAGAVLESPWVGLAAGACALVPAFGPERPKRFSDVALGPLHAFLVGVVALGLLAGVALLAAARSLPGATLPELGPVGAWLGDVRRLGAFLVVLLGASALVAPAYALVRRFSTPAMASRTYLGVGRGVALAAFALAILASPVCYALDRVLGDQLGQIALNEPTAYKPTDGEEG